MKSVSLFAAALVFGSAIAAPADAKLEKRQLGNMVNSVVNPKGGKVKDPAGAAPRRVTIAARTKVAGSKSVKIRYGPYKVPSMGTKNTLGEEGSLWNYSDTPVDKPCEECTIVGFQSGLEYADGKNANIDTGMWLHHMVLLSGGPGRSDATCLGSPVSMPHMIVAATPQNSERLFSSGNERTAAILPHWNENNVGYKLKKDDKFGLIVDLMNENMQEKVVYLTITYDFLDGIAPGYDDMRPVWFDVAQCLTSEWPAPYNDGNYTVQSMIWKANFEGEIIGAAGHLHDGGQRVTLDVDGKRACTSEASYGGSPEYVQKTAMGHKNSATVHLSKMSLCVNDKLMVKKLVKGQNWRLRAEYDYGKNKGNRHGDGKQANVMGIAIMFVRVKK